MKPRRTWPLRILIGSLVLIMLTGAYLAITHQGAQPDHSDPAASELQG